ncbi:MAG: cyclic nucleotide-binding domain-containing protein [Deltaproteobacteria bacterium]|nr:cyclic nucleotide-binding domain-containing protein [Deltaproteobacteria bacterium]
MNHTQNNSKRPQVTPYTPDTDKDLVQVNALIEKGDTSGAVSLLTYLIRETARAKDFQKAEALLEKLSEADPMALSEIYSAGEFINAEKEAALDKDRIASWSPLYDTLTPEETHELYFALKELSREANVTLIQQGQKNNALYFVEQGELRVVFEKDDHEYLVQILKKGDVAGTESFFNPTVSTLSVVTQTSVRLNVLDIERLRQCEKKTPALESKLREFCEKQNNTARLLMEKALERRHYKRFPTEALIAIQLLYASKKPAGKPFKGRLSDLSAGGLCFFIKLQNKESARMLLGRKLQMQFPISAASSESIYEEIGTVVAVHYHLSLDYSVHVRFDTPMDPAVIENITG